ncbi:MAG: hypothetical protein ACK40E_04940, partial [Caldimicrobium sp.]
CFCLISTELVVATFRLREFMLFHSQAKACGYLSTFLFRRLKPAATSSFYLSAQIFYIFL